jgi:hypothetical protein
MKLNKMISASLLGASLVALAGSAHAATSWSFGGSGASRTLTVTPAAGQTGSATTTQPTKRAAKKSTNNGNVAVPFFC